MVHKNYNYVSYDPQQGLVCCNALRYASVRKEILCCQGTGEMTSTGRKARIPKLAKSLRGPPVSPGTEDSSQKRKIKTKIVKTYHHNICLVSMLIYLYYTLLQVYIFSGLNQCVLFDCSAYWIVALDKSLMF